MLTTLFTLWFLTAVPFHDPAPPPAARAADAPTGHWTAPLTLRGTLDGRPVKGKILVYLPAGYGSDPATRWPLVIALHGWNHSPALLRDRGDLARHADRHHVVLAVPATAKTVYESAAYPDSRRTGLAAPGARWVGEVVLPWLRARFAVHPDRAHTAVIGYSTGGRGAVLVAEEHPDFAFVGSLSGTFDLAALAPTSGEYKIHAAVYGPRDRFPERWRRDDALAPDHLDALAGTRLFIGHGAADTVVPPSQLAALQTALARRGLAADVVLVPGAGHDWAYWTSQWDALFAAMDRAFAAAAEPR